MGAHPGRAATPATLPVDGYGEDYDFWVEARAATRRDDYDDVDPRTGCSTSRRRSSGSSGSARERVAALRAKAAPDSWHADAAAYPPDLDAPVNAWERAAVWGARYLADACRRARAPTRCSRARASRTSSAWLGVQLARDAGCDVQLTAEIGLWGYDADARPIRSCSTTATSRRATMLGDAQTVLGALVGGAGHDDDRLSRRRADRPHRQHQLDAGFPPRPFLVGSGGGNDVASTAAECVVVATLTPAAHARASVAT